MSLFFSKKSKYSDPQRYNNFFKYRYYVKPYYQIVPTKDFIACQNRAAATNQALMNIFLEYKKEQNSQSTKNKQIWNRILEWKIVQIPWDFIFGDSDNRKNCRKKTANEKNNVDDKTIELNMQVILHEGQIKTRKFYMGEAAYKFDDERVGFVEVKNFGKKTQKIEQNYCENGTNNEGYTKTHKDFIQKQLEVDEKFPDHPRWSYKDEDTYIQFLQTLGLQIDLTEKNYDEESVDRVV